MLRKAMKWTLPMAFCVLFLPACDDADPSGPSIADGSYDGSTNQGGDVDFYVDGNQVQQFIIQLNVSGDWGSQNVTWQVGSASIDDGEFDMDAEDGDHEIEISGDYEGSGEFEGTWQASGFFNDSPVYSYSNSGTWEADHN